MDDEDLDFGRVFGGVNVELRKGREERRGIEFLDREVRGLNGVVSLDSCRRVMLLERRFLGGGVQMGLFLRCCGIS